MESSLAAYKLVASTFQYHDIELCKMVDAELVLHLTGVGEK